MIIGTKNFEAYIGETIKFEFLVQDDAGAPLDLTGAVAIFAMRKNGTSTNAVERACTLDIPNSKLLFTLLSAETVTKGTYKYEVRMKRDSETDSLLIGEITLLDALLTVI